MNIPIIFWNNYDPTLARAWLGRNLKLIVTKLKSIIKLQKKKHFTKQSKGIKTPNKTYDQKHFKIQGCHKTNKNALVSKPLTTQVLTRHLHSKRVPYTAEASGFIPLARWAKLHVITN